MFKSNGYFNCFRCPFFVSGLCERPYCHFRHAKPPDDGGSSKELGRPLSPINNVEATAQAIRRLEEADSDIYSKPSAYTRPTGGVPQYRPTPKSKIASKASASAVPEYTPTPKSELQRLKHRTGDLEYDPVSNFSFSGGSGSKGGGYKEEVKYVPTSKKTDGSPEMAIQIPKFCSESALVNEDVHFSDDDSGNDSAANGENGGQNENGCIDPSEFQSPVEDIGGVDKGYGDGSELYSSVKTEGSHEKGDKLDSEKLTTTVSKSSPDKHSKSGKSHSSSSHNHKRSSSSSSNKHHSSSSKSSSSQSSHKKSSSSHHSSSKSSSSSNRSSSKSSSSRTDSKSSSLSSSGKKPSSHHSSSSSTSKHSHSVKPDGSKSSSSHAEKTDRHATKRHSSKDGSEGEPDVKKAKAKSSHSSIKSKSSGHRSHHSSGSSNHRHSTDSKRPHSTDMEAMSKKIKLDAEGSGNRHKDKDGVTFSRKLSLEVMDTSKFGLLRRQSSEVNKELFGEDSDPDEPSQSWGNEDEITEMEMQYLQQSDFDDEDAFLETARIYKTEPGVPASIGAAAKRQKEDKQPNGKEAELGKKRVAHRTSDQIMRRPPVKKKLVINPVQVMMDRQRAIQEAAAAKQAAAASASPSTSGVSTAAGTPGMKRIAHVPQPSTSKTAAVTADKNQKRIAHVPTQKNLKRPVIPAEYGGKVPTNYRQRYLNLIIDECLKVCSSEEEAFQRGEEEEKDIYKRASSKKLYTNLAVGIIRKLRAEGESGACTSPTGLNGFQFSHNMILGGTHALKTSFTIKRSGAKTVPDVFRGSELYNRLVKYILTEEQLRSNGFPRPPESGKKGEAKFYTSISREPSSITASALVSTRDEKVCLRCAKRFIILPDGAYAKQEECVYHWGKAWKRKVRGQFENVFNCCGGDLNSPPCGVAKLHVHETNKVENLKGYMTTMPKSPPRDGNFGVFALDCEMVYTFAGIELARVTVIDDKCEVIYESLVRPDSEVIDYNTRFSGLSAKDLVGVKTSLRDVQAVLLQKFSDKTILIGHSLESDLMALRMIHSSVVDTSVVFPHRNGPPQKRALRNIVSDHLQKIIQNDVGGHDSQEDAVACMQLMQWKVKEDAKLELGIK